jgi:hypothetical protein
MLDADACTGPVRTERDLLDHVPGRLSVAALSVKRLDRCSPTRSAGYVPVEGEPDADGAADWACVYSRSGRKAARE